MIVHRTESSFVTKENLCSLHQLPNTVSEAPVQHEMVSDVRLTKMLVTFFSPGVKRGLKSDQQQLYGDHRSAFNTHIHEYCIPAPQAWCIILLPIKRIPRFFNCNVLLYLLGHFHISI